MAKTRAYGLKVTAEDREVLTYGVYRDGSGKSKRDLCGKMKRDPLGA